MTLSEQFALMYGALVNIRDSFTEKHAAALKRWEGQGTAAFEDHEWMDATAIKSLADIAREAIEHIDAADKHAAEEAEGERRNNGQFGVGA
jgi:hypothetical protein